MRDTAAAVSVVNARHDRCDSLISPALTRAYVGPCIWVVQGRTGRCFVPFAVAAVAATEPHSKAQRPHGNCCVEEAFRLTRYFPVWLLSQCVRPRESTMPPTLSCRKSSKSKRRLSALTIQLLRRSSTIGRTFFQSRYCNKVGGDVCVFEWDAFVVLQLSPGCSIALAAA